MRLRRPGRRDLAAAGHQVIGVDVSDVQIERAAGWSLPPSSSVPMSPS